MTQKTSFVVFTNAATHQYCGEMVTVDVMVCAPVTTTFKHRTSAGDRAQANGLFGIACSPSSYHSKDGWVPNTIS